MGWSPEHRPRITVFGTGYLGLAHAACLAEAGFAVLGVDTDPALVTTLNAGRPPIAEPGLTALVRKGLAAGRLGFTTSYRRAARTGDVHFLCVGTPQRADGSADLSQVAGCLGRLAPLLRRPCLVVGKSTVPVGTARAAAAMLAARAPAGTAAELAWNPEFLREGRAVADSRHPDRIVAGVGSARAESLLRQVYAPQLAAGVPFLVTDVATAELVKLAANAFLATKISFVNGMAAICETAGADPELLSRALGHDPRIGAVGLRPGLGFGGGCLPKDTRALAGQAASFGAGGFADLLRSVDAINTERRSRMVEIASSLAGGSLEGARVGVLGLTFKAGTDDIRDSPALAVTSEIARRGATVTAYDPAVTGRGAAAFDGDGGDGAAAFDGDACGRAAASRARQALPASVRFTDSSLGAARGADVLLVLTDWPEFGDTDPDELREVVATPAVADARHVLDPVRWREAGWHFRALGTADGDGTVDGVAGSGSASDGAAGAPGASLLHA